MIGFSAILFPSVRYDGDNLVILEKEFVPSPDKDAWEETLSTEDLDYSQRILYANGERLVLPGADMPY